MIKNSPASEAGLQIGDILLKVNGVSASGLSSEQIREKFKGKGQLKLEIKRENKTLRKELKLRKLL